MIRVARQLGINWGRWITRAWCVIVCVSCAAGDADRGPGEARANSSKVSAKRQDLEAVRFGLTTRAGTILLFGWYGTVSRSSNRGMEWLRSDCGLHVSRAVEGPPGRVVVLECLPGVHKVGGSRLAVSDDEGVSWRCVAWEGPNSPELLDICYAGMAGSFGIDASGSMWQLQLELQGDVVNARASLREGLEHFAQKLGRVTKLEGCAEYCWVLVSTWSHEPQWENRVARLKSVPIAEPWYDVTVAGIRDIVCCEAGLILLREANGVWSLGDSSGASRSVVSDMLGGPWQFGATMVQAGRQVIAVNSPFRDALLLEWTHRGTSKEVRRMAIVPGAVYYIGMLGNGDVLAAGSAGSYRVQGGEVISVRTR